MRKTRQFKSHTHTNTLEFACEAHHMEGNARVVAERGRGAVRREDKPFHKFNRLPRRSGLLPTNSAQRDT